VKLTSHLHVVPRWNMRRDTHLLLLYVFTAWTGAKLTFCLYLAPSHAGGDWGGGAVQGGVGWVNHRFCDFYLSFLFFVSRGVGGRMIVLFHFLGGRGGGGGWGGGGSSRWPWLS